MSKDIWSNETGIRLSTEGIILCEECPECKVGFEIWGVSSNAPSFHSNRSDAAERMYPNLELSYDLGRPQSPNNVNGTYEHEIRPVLWNRQQGQEWYMVAAKVPGTYPPKPGADIPISSSTLGDSSWQSDIGIIAKHAVIGKEQIDEASPISYCLGSRAIYLDGVQTWLAYRVKTRLLSTGLSDATFYGENLGDVYIIDIANPNQSDHYLVGTLNGLIEGGNPGNAPSQMETHFLKYHYHISGGANNINTNVLTPVNGFQAGKPQLPCNASSYGTEYYISSSYYPSSKYNMRKSAWSVARVKLDTLEVFCTEISESELERERVGVTGRAYVGVYWIVMPTCRVYKDSSVAGHDEAWVCAINRFGNNPKIVTGQWLTNVTSSTGFADGTLHVNDIKNTILDSTTVDSRYSTEQWKNIEIRSYNRVYDPNTGHSKDLMLFTTQDEANKFTLVEGVVCDFEDGNLNSGLEDADIQFKVGGLVETSGWMSSSFEPFDGGFSAISNPVIADVDQSVYMSLTFNKAQSGYIYFDFRHRNQTPVFLQQGDFSHLSADPQTDNYLDIRLDGKLLNSANLIDDNPDLPEISVDNGNGWVPVSTSRMDNDISPEPANKVEANFFKWRKVRIYVGLGSHTLSWTQRRAVKDNGNLYSQVDNLILGDIMGGEDTLGKKRWIFNGEKVQKAEWWSWPRRDDEDENDLAGRVSTAPDFVTLDKAGRILYGNPHYIVRLIPDEEDPGFFKLDEAHGARGGSSHPESDTGFVLLTATLASIKVEIGETEPPCEDPDPEYEDVDVVLDPPWGSFQILPYGEGGDYQIRGGNASLRDATVQPFISNDYPIGLYEGVQIYERFTERLRGNGTFPVWTQRCHSWTITNSGNSLRPHVEVIWHPTHYIEAYPKTEQTVPYWPNPPHQTGFETSGSDKTTFAEMRPRDPLSVSKTSNKPRWTRTNVIVPATYSDSLSQEMQSVWVRQLYNDPDTESWGPNINPDTWGVWPSAQWQLVQSRIIPTGFLMRIYWTGSATTSFSIAVDACGEPFNLDDRVVFFGHESIGLRNWRPLTDFDVVDTPWNE